MGKAGMKNDRLSIWKHDITCKRSSSEMTAGLNLKSEDKVRRCDLRFAV